MERSSWRIFYLIFVTLSHIRENVAELVDLSYTYNIDAPTSPKLRQFEHEIVKKGMNKFNVWVELNNFCTSEHSGTHLDAPIHFSKTGWSVEEIPLDRLFRVPSVMIDFSQHKKHGSNYEIKANDFHDWELTHGTIPDGAVVLIQTGWGKRSANIDHYSGIDEYQKLNFPGLSIGAAEWLASHGSRNKHAKGIVGVGVDTLSLDPGQSVRYPAHVAILKNNIFGIENVANMDKLPATGFHLTVMPVRIGGGSGAPARLVAEIGSGAIYSSASHAELFGGSFVLLISYNFFQFLFHN